MIIATWQNFSKEISAPHHIENILNYFVRSNLLLMQQHSLLSTQLKFSKFQSFKVSPSSTPLRQYHNGNLVFLHLKKAFDSSVMTVISN